MPTKIIKKFYDDINYDPKNCVLFVGSGLSFKSVRKRGKGFPLWSDLMKSMIKCLEKNGSSKELIEKLKNNLAHNNYLAIASEFKRQIGIDKYHEFLKSTFEPDDLVWSEIHDTILKIGFKGIITTNFDKVFEYQSSKLERGIRPLVSCMDPNRYTPPFFAKIHGCISDPPGIILTKEDYKNLKSGHQYETYKELMRAIFTGATILVSGYSLTDPDFIEIIDELNEIFHGGMRTVYDLMFPATERDCQKWLNKNVQIIPLQVPSEIIDFFSEMLDLPEKNPYIVPDLVKELENVVEVARTKEPYENLSNCKMASYLCICDELILTKEWHKSSHDCGRALTVFVEHCLKRYLSELGIEIDEIYENGKCSSLIIKRKRIKTDGITNQEIKGLLSIYLRGFKDVDEQQENNLTGLSAKKMEDARKAAFLKLVEKIRNEEEEYKNNFKDKISIEVAKSKDDYNGLSVLDTQTYEKNSSQPSWPEEQLDDIFQLFPEGVIIAKNRIGSVLGYVVVLPMKPEFVDGYLKGNKITISDWNPKTDCFNKDLAKKQPELNFQIDNICIFNHKNLRNRLVPKFIKNIENLIGQFPHCNTISAIIVSNDGNELVTMAVNKFQFKKKHEPVPNGQKGTFHIWTITNPTKKAYTHSF